MTNSKRASRADSKCLPAARRDRQPALWLMIAVQLSLIGWGAEAASRCSLTSLVLLPLAIGLSSGIFGLLAAHEMIHSNNRAQNAIGMVMLSAVTYRHFRIAHLHGHHRWAATPQDPATARRGESLYAFLRRSIAGQAIFAYRLERRRLTRREGAWWQHRLSQDCALYAIVYGSLYAILGRNALAFQAAQSAVAIVVLGSFDYVAHYGLRRNSRPEGGYEPLSDSHSWNAGGSVANLLLLNMGHHADHHRYPARPHSRLAPISGSPQLPGGYAGAIALALVPQLWRRKMDARLYRATGTPPMAAHDWQTRP
jgi:alkane 1-monooxygenase